MKTTTPTAPSHVVFVAVEGQCLAYEVMMIKGKVPGIEMFSVPPQAVILSRYQEL